MIKTVLSVLIFIVVIFSSNVNSLEIEKVTPSLQYLYNYYYDPGDLKIKCDSSTIDEDKDTMRSGKIFDSLPLEEIEPVYKPNVAALFFIDSIPYIWTVLSYNGNESDLQALGVLVGAYHGGVIGVRFPLSILPQVAALSTVIAICDNAIVEHEDAFTSTKPSLDVSIVDISADLVHNNLGFTGKGVVIGIINTGIDYFNYDFRDSLGNTRVKYLWDQSSTIGSSPPEYGFGSEWTEAQIDSVLQGITGAQVSGLDTNGHGTHVAENIGMHLEFW